MNKQIAESQKKKRKILISLFAAVVAFAIAFGVVQAMMDKKDDRITVSIGSKAFTEQQILGHLLAEVIETNPKYKVDKKIGLGGTSICWEALKTGSIDMYVEYSAGMYLNSLKQPFEAISGDEIVSRITPLLKDEGVILAGRLGFKNDYELTVTREYATKNNLKTIDDLKKLADSAVVAPTFEYVNRADGMLGVNSIYGITFKKVTPMEAGLRYSALKSGDVQIINTFSTDGMKYKLDLVALEDPKNVHLAQEACIIFNKETYEKYPDLSETLSVLEQKISAEDMVKMNYKVDMEGKLPEDVAHEFLVEKDIVK